MGVRLVPAKVSLLILLAFPAASGEPGADYADARKLAQDAVTDAWPGFLDQVQITWPDEAPIAMPESGEIYLISGYFSYICIRLAWDPGGVRGGRVGMRRMFAHNWEGESFSSESFEVDRAALERAWRAAHLLLNAGVQTKETVEDIHRYAMFHSSAGQTYWIRLRRAGRSDPIYNQVFSSSFYSTRHSRPDFEYVRTRALFSILHSLVPPEGQRKTAPLADWKPFFVGELSRAVKELLSNDGEVGSLRPWRRPVRLLLETSLRAAGQLGAGEAEKAIRTLHAGLPPTGDHSVRELRREAERALERIGLQRRWDPHEAIRLIHATPRDSSIELDQVNWVRELYFRRDPQDYRSHLLSELHDPATDHVVMREIIADVASRYPDRVADEFPKVLKHPDPTIVADVADALLDLKPGHPGAIRALNRLASDPEVPIPPGDRWSSRFARGRALSRLASKKMPAGARWSAELIRRRLRVPGEDGRMIRRLIQELKILELDPSAEEQRQAYRRALEGKPNCGLVFACQELRQLGDRVCDKEESDLEAAAKRACPSGKQERSWRKRWPAQTYYRFRRMMQSR